MEIGTLIVDVDTARPGGLPIRWNGVFVVASMCISLVGSWRFLQSMHSVERMALTSFLPSGFVYGACSVWSLHFTGMNAVNFGVDEQGREIRIRYNVLWVVVSVLFPVASATISSYILAIARQEVRRTWAKSHRRPERQLEQQRLAFYSHSVLSGDDLPWCGILSRRRTVLSCMSGASMTLGIACMHYSGHLAMVNVQQVHPLWGIGLVAVAALVLNCLASWLASNPRQSIFYTAILAVFITAAVAVPHYASALTMRYYPHEGVSDSEGLMGGPNSSIQDLVFVANFIVGTLLFNMITAYHHDKKVSKITRDLQEVVEESGETMAVRAPQKPQVSEVVESVVVADGGSNRLGREGELEELVRRKFAHLLKEMSEGERDTIARNFDSRGKEYLTCSPLVLVVDTPRNNIHWSSCRTPRDHSALLVTPQLLSRGGGEGKGGKVPPSVARVPPGGGSTSGGSCRPPGRPQWDVLRPLEGWSTPKDSHGVPQRVTAALPWSSRFTTPRPPKVPPAASPKGPLSLPVLADTPMGV